ncbi:serine/threonine-protein kinase [Kitasatospora sp. NPDC101183]|uniref:serine/threonine-protein kinase n=1 Tax=Kitasatospora sp. NPDC101183 TaxID=3364100 RepID=UPI0038142063
MAEADDWTGLPDGITPLTPGDRRELGGYQLLARLGSGGMGIVYLARSVTGRTAAVKVVRPELLGEREGQERFRRESAAASRIPRRFTAPLLDADIGEDGAWMATAFIPGLSLQQSVHAFGPLPTDSLYALWYGLLRALHAVHAAGVVHRDLKPSNVLLTASGPRLIDFGISLVTGSPSLTSTGAFIGTPGYLAPEQITGRPVTVEADVFALGAAMAFAATGSPPFDGENIVNAIFNVLQGEPRISSLPADLDGWVRACLSKEPAHRPTVDGLLGALPDQRVTTAWRQLAGDWLPEAVSRATLRRTQFVLDLDGPYLPPPGGAPEHPPGPRTAVTIERPAPGGPTVRLRSPALSAGAAPAPTGPAATRAGGDRPPTPGPPPVLPDSPPNPSPVPPAPGGAHPAPDTPLRTFASPLEAELPPPPRTGLRRRWFLRSRDGTSRG